MLAPCVSDMVPTPGFSIHVVGYLQYCWPSSAGQIGWSVHPLLVVLSVDGSSCVLVVVPWPRETMEWLQAPRLALLGPQWPPAS